MIINEINGGAKLPYEINGNFITFDNALSLNLSAFERDDAVHIDICKSIYGSLVMGVIPGFATKYAAQIDIPARQYETAVTVDTVDTGTGEEQETVTAVPLDIKNITLTLWGNE